MKSYSPIRVTIRMMSIVCVLIVAWGNFAIGDERTLLALSTSLLAGGSILSMSPLSYERFYLPMSLSFLILVLAAFFPPVSAIILALNNVRRIMGRYSNEKTLPKKISPIQCMENDTEVMYAILNLALWIILLAFSVSPLGHFSGYVLLVLSACSYFFIYLHLWLERPLFFTEERAEKIRALTKEARRMMPMRNPEEEQRMRKTFDRAVEKMEKDKVFLDTGMSEAALAHEIGTNRAYLSKAVNVYSGQNFPQFVNSYRIAYSKELINNDRNAKFQDIAAMAGFQSPVAFDVTFKLHTGQTPSEYLTSLSTIEERAP